MTMLMRVGVCFGFAVIGASFWFKGCLAHLHAKTEPLHQAIEHVIVVGEGEAEGLGPTLPYEELIGAEDVGYQWPDLDERTADLLALTGGHGDVGECHGEARHVRECELQVEQALVQELPRSPVGQRTRVTQLGIDHQGSLVEPQQVALESRHAARIRVRAVEQVED